MLRSGDPRETLERLLTERAPIYSEADFTIDSEDGPHTAVVERIVAAVGRERGAHAMTEKITVKLAHEATTFMSVQGCFAMAGALLKPFARGAVPVVTDEHVAKLHLAPLLQFIARGWYRRATDRAGAGRRHEKLCGASRQLCGELLDTGVDRSGLIVALGGGVIGDLTGLCRRAAQARHRLRADSDDAAGAGGFFGRRQDGDQHARRARISSACSISRSIVIADTDAA